MDKKTIGGFIAALRKANGMTPKDLADRLNVSDKTVSRWERDDGAPDLAVIPVIAEIFGVTCDELLRGERKSPAERAETAEEPDSTPKAEKQRQRLLKTALSQYRNRTYIAIGVSVIGIIVALICNLAFQQAILGFFLAATFFAAGPRFLVYTATGLQSQNDRNNMLPYGQAMHSRYLLCSCNAYTMPICLTQALRQGPANWSPYSHSRQTLLTPHPKFWSLLKFPWYPPY